MIFHNLWCYKCPEVCITLSIYEGVQNQKQKKKLITNVSHFDSIIDLNWRIVTPLLNT